MTIYYILLIIWISVSIAFTVVMGVASDEKADAIDYVTFFAAYGLFWPITLPLLGITYLVKTIINFISEHF